MLASSGDATEPCPVPLSLTVTAPSSRMPSPQPLLDQADGALVADPVFDKADEPFLAHRPEEVPDVSVKNVVHLPVGDPHHQGIQRIMWSAPGTKPVRVSRPAEFHRQPLAEPSVRLSPHSAPIRQTCRSFRSASVRRVRRLSLRCFGESDSRGSYEPQSA